MAATILATAGKARVGVLRGQAPGPDREADDRVVMPRWVVSIAGRPNSEHTSRHLASGNAMDVRALIFDIGGTVFDWHAALVETLRRHDCFEHSDHAEFALTCRAGFLDLTGRVVRGEEAWMTSDEILARVSHEVCARLGVTAPAAAEHDLAHAWRRMPAWPGAGAAIAALRKRYVVAPLTILSWPMAVGSSRLNGIDWDGILSCDLLGVYKPDPRCYERAAAVLNCRADEIAMVASHPSDLRAARPAGYRTVYLVPRLEDPGEDYRDTGFRDEFDVIAADFADLARKLG